MVSPRGPEEWFAMLCYKNGALAREEVRDRVCGGDWEKFDALLRASPPGNDGQFGLFLVMEEIVPICNVKGIFRVNEREEAVAEFADAAHEVRAVVEGRFLSMKVNAQKLGLPTAPTRILATGGGSTNEGIMQVLADVFNADVFVADTADSAAVGAALRAEHGLACRRNGHWVTFEAGEPQGLRRVATPQPKAVEVYSNELLGRFAAFERSIAVQAQERKV
jgi:xylulokinase